MILETSFMYGGLGHSIAVTRTTKAYSLCLLSFVYGISWGQFIVSFHLYVISAFR